ncbi:MAG: hypothetical protein DME25_16220 [Verrucomicrobia bacterium]|nr:MAG: hypothetical protein DME25_16220 [Verrucomicrobiota bacterium]
MFAGGFEARFDLSGREGDVENCNAVEGAFEWSFCSAAVFRSVLVRSVRVSLPIPFFLPSIFLS